MTAERTCERERASVGGGYDTRGESARETMRESAARNKRAARPDSREGESACARA